MAPLVVISVALTLGPAALERGPALGRPRPLALPPVGGLSAGVGGGSLVRPGLSPTARALGPAVPEGTAGTSKASGGATELTEENKFQTAEKPAGLTDQTLTLLDVGLGALLATGNARTFAGTSTTNFKLQRGRHRLGSGLALNYARAAVAETWETTAFNVQGRARYDVFFARRWGAYVNGSARHDPFQGLDLRSNVGPGAAHYFLTADNHQLWAELGYDFQYDLRRDANRGVLDGDGNPVFGPDGVQLLLDKHAFRHAVRVFAGYSNRLDERLSLDLGVEYLQSFLVLQQARLNGDVSLSVALRERLSLATTFALRFDNDPLPNVRKLDTATALSLVYRLL